MAKNQQPDSRRRTTQQEIADALKVSKMSVSRAFRGDPKCGPALRKRILQKAEELGYRPDPLQSLHMARLRAGGRGPKSTVAVLDMWDREHAVRSNSSLIRMLHGMRARAVELGLAVEVFAPMQEGYSGTRLEKILWTRGIRGMIALPLPPGMSALDLKLDKLASVALGYSLHEPDIDRISHNHFEAMWEVMGRLRERGKRRVGLALSEELENRVGYRWHGAYHEFMRRHSDLVESATFVVPTGEQFTRFSASTEKLFLRWLDRRGLDAVVSLSPCILDLLDERNSAGGEPVEFVDLDWYPGKYAEPRRPLRMWVNQRYESLGAAAVNHVFGLWARNAYGIPKEPQTVLIKGVVGNYEIPRGR